MTTIKRFIVCVRRAGDGKTHLCECAFHEVCSMTTIKRFIVCAGDGKTHLCQCACVRFRERVRVCKKMLVGKDR